MKRIGALICLMVMMVSMLAPACFAENGAAADKSGLKIESSTPEDGAKGVSVENLSVKLYFNADMVPASESAKKANAKQFKLTDKKGKNIPVKVYYSDEEEGLMMVVSDITNKKKSKIEGDTDYTLTIGKNLTATDGTKLGEKQTITFKTLNQARSTMIYTLMMVVMMVGMVFYSTKSAKKAAEKEKTEKGKADHVNPYKEAKKTGKSVEEIVERENKKKAKQAQAAAKKKAAEEELERSIMEKLRKEENKRVSAPKPISAAGSEYKVKVKKTQPKQKTPNQNKKGTTNPKNQTGKQKNSKNKSKKK